MKAACNIGINVKSSKAVKQILHSVARISEMLVDSTLSWSDQAGLGYDQEEVRGGRKREGFNVWAFNFSSER